MILKGWEMENSCSIYFFWGRSIAERLVNGDEVGGRRLREMEGCEVHNKWGIYFFFLLQGHVGE